MADIEKENCINAKSNLIDSKKIKHQKSEEKLFLLHLISVFLSSTIVILMWFTNAFNNAILQQIVLKNDSFMLNWWLKPPVDSIVKAYIFNYTNTDRFLNGSDNKIKIEEVGPYAYREAVEKINLQFDGDFVSFNENKTHFFDPKYGNESLTEEDLVHVPNIPFISAIPYVERLPFVPDAALKSILAISKPQQFHTLSIKELLFGYRNNFLDLVGKMKWDLTTESVGLFAPRHGLLVSRLSFNLGLKNVEDVGKIFSFNQMRVNKIWKSSECNRIEGSDGIFYGAKKVRNKEEISIFMTETCREIPMRFEENRFLHGSLTRFYTPPLDIFSSTSNASYYCELKSVNEQINGILDVSDCMSGSPPLLVSFPHFFEGDPKLFQPFEGLQPNKKLHTPFLFIHPRLGVVLSGSSKLQVNIKVKKFNKYFEKFDDLILPIGWIDHSIRVSGYC